MAQIVCKHLSIRGKVQGVSYRASAADEARGRGLGGWVRNRLDGSVEAVVFGPAAAVEAFVSWARQGPTAARVDDIALADAPRPDTAGFEVWPTQ